MTLNAPAYLKAAYPPLPKQPEKPRAFKIHWNNKKVRRGKRIDVDAWHEAEGVKFSNGRIVLDFGPVYETMYDLERAFNDMGEHRIDWLDVQQEAAQ